MRFKLSPVAIVDAKSARLLQEHAFLVLLDEAETGLQQILADQRISAADLMRALSD